MTYTVLEKTNLEKGCVYNMSMNKMKAAIVGFGGMGGWHAKHLLASDVAELAGIWDINPEKRAKASDRGIHVYESYEDLLADKSVELVTVATPNDVHEELVIKALDAGKNVICEKPVTMTVESLDRMIAAAERNGVRFSTHQNRRWDVDYLAMKQVHDSGEIGRVINIESRVHGSRGIPGDWRQRKQYGGGMLYDWGIHLIDQMLMIFGFDQVDSVYCIADHITNDEVDDGFRLDIYFKGGERATIEVGTTNFISMPRFYLRADNGTALIADWKEETQVVRWTHEAEGEVVPVQTAAGLTKTMAPRDGVTTETYRIPCPVSDVHDYYRHFINAIRTGCEQDVTNEHMRTDLKVILAAFKSIETGKIVKF